MGYGIISQLAHVTGFWVLNSAKARLRPLGFGAAAFVLSFSGLPSRSPIGRRLVGEAGLEPAKA